MHESVSLAKRWVPRRRHPLDRRIRRPRVVQVVARGTAAVAVLPEIAPILTLERVRLAILRLWAA